MNERKLGIVLSYMSTGIQALVGLIYLPMLFHYLTPAQYGIYQLMGSAIAYLSIMEFGLANTTTRYISRALAINNTKEMNTIIATSHTIYCIVSVVLFFFGLVFYFCIDNIYSHTLSINELGVAKQIYMIMLINVAVLIQSNIFTSVINAHERFLFLRGLNLLQVIIQPLLVWGLLAWHSNVLNIALAQTICLWAVVGINYWYCKRNLHLSFHLQLTYTPFFKELIGFSIFVFLHMLIDQIYWRSGQLILGAVIGPIAVAIYAIAMQVAMFVSFMPTTMGGVFLPKLSASIATQQGLNSINSLFCKLGRLQFMLFMLLLIGFIFLGKIFLLLWIGHGYELVYWLVLIIMVGYLFDVTQSVGIPTLQAMKKHAFRAYVYVVMAVLNITLAIPLAKLYGEIGCATSTAICLWLGPGIAMNWYYWYLGIDIKTFFMHIAKLIVPVSISALVTWLIFMCLPLKTEWFNFIWHGILLILVYAIIMWCLACNAYEKNLIFQPMHQLMIYTKKLFAPKEQTNSSV